MLWLYVTTSRVPTAGIPERWSIVTESVVGVSVFESREAGEPGTRGTGGTRSPADKFIVHAQTVCSDENDVTLHLPVSAVGWLAELETSVAAGVGATAGLRE